MAESTEQTKVEEQPEDTAEKKEEPEESTAPDSDEKTPAAVQTEKPAEAAKVIDDGTPVVLVTGASGFIATHTIKNLLVEGRYRVRGTVRNSSNEAKVAPLHALVPDAARPLELVDADLTSEEAWKDAVRGCTYVLHIASPFPRDPPKNVEEGLIRPAVEGTLSVLRACAESGTVKRVVLVSSIAAVSSGLNGESGKVYTEDDWSVEENCFPYELSKYKAERAAWDFVEKLEDSKKFEFITVCPSAVIGPVLTAATTSNTTISACITDVLANKLPGIADVSMPLVDVRDVADAICSAMEKPGISNKRFILANETLHFNQIAETIAAEFKPQGYKVPTKPINKIMLWAFKKTAKGKPVKAMEGKSFSYNIDRMKTELQITPRPVKSTILDTCYALIDAGSVKKSKGYLGHPDNRPAEEPKAKETPAEGEPPKEETAEGSAKTEETPAEEPPKAEETSPEEPPKAEETPAEEPPKAEETPAEEPPKAEETPAEEPPKAEETPAEEPPKAEETPAEEPPKAEETPAEEPPKAEETQAQEPPKAEETQAQEPPKAEETPAEEAPKVEETSVEEPTKEEETLAEETPKAEETPAEESPKKEETPADEPPKEEETPAEEPPKEETPADEPPKEEEMPAEEPPKEETPAEEPPKEETATEEPPKEETTAEEET